MYISFKAWFDTCNKMSLSVKWYRCLDLAIYTDLFTLIWSLKICISLSTLLIYLSTNQWRWNSNYAWIWILIFHGYCFFKSFIMLYCVCVKRKTFAIVCVFLLLVTLPALSGITGNSEQKTILQTIEELI